MSRFSSGIMTRLPLRETRPLVIAAFDPQGSQFDNLKTKEKGLPHLVLRHPPIVRSSNSQYYPTRAKIYAPNYLMVDPPTGTDIYHWAKLCSFRNTS